MFEFLWIYMHTHMFYVKLYLIYVYIKKQAGKPCKRANALYNPNEEITKKKRNCCYSFKITSSSSPAVTNSSVNAQNYFVRLHLSLSKFNFNYKRLGYA
jgi:hypothetical protein